MLQGKLEHGACSRVRCDGLAEKPGMAAVGVRFLEREGLDGRVNSVPRFLGVAGRVGCRQELLERARLHAESLNVHGA